MTGRRPAPEAGRDPRETAAADALRCYDLDPAARLTWLGESENAVYRVDEPDGRRHVLRVHRPGYHARAGIDSELAWVAALRADGVARTAAVVPARDGSTVVLGREARDADGRRCVLFAWAPGEHPREDSLEPAAFEQLGALAARLHRHARHWRRPAWFTRPRWDWAGCLGPGANWGPWQAAPGLGPAEREVIGRAAEALRGRLAAFGAGPDRFGLVHADMRLANLLVDEHGGLTLLDFDDCGFGWHLYDLGAALSFVEDSPAVPELVAAWVRGYRREAPLTAAEQAELGTFVLLRRLLLVAWVGSHPGTELARATGAAFTRASCDLAEAWLTGRFLPPG